MRIMKIDFNENGMTINFDKVPKFLYFNEEGKGCGQVLLDGVRRKGLQDIKIEAQTRDEKGWPPLKYRIQYIEPKTGGGPQYISNMKEELCIGIKILDIDVFSDFTERVHDMLSDTRIPDSIRQEHFNKIFEALRQKEYVKKPYEAFKEDN